MIATVTAFALLISTLQSQAANGGNLEAFSQMLDTIRVSLQIPNRLSQLASIMCLLCEPCSLHIGDVFLGLCDSSFRKLQQCKATHIESALDPIKLEKV